MCGEECLHRFWPYGSQQARAEQYTGKYLPDDRRLVQPCEEPPHDTYHEQDDDQLDQQYPYV